MNDLYTIIGRAADKDGNHIEVKYAGIPASDHTALAVQTETSIREKFQRAFGHKDCRAAIAVLPFVPELDDNEGDTE